MIFVKDYQDSSIYLVYFENTDIPWGAPNHLQEYGITYSHTHNDIFYFEFYWKKCYKYLKCSVICKQTGPDRTSLTLQIFYISL